MRKPSLKTLRKNADTLFSKVCFKIYGDKCECCGKEAHEIHHFFAKSIASFLRYNIQNGVQLCTYCHIIRIHSQGDPRVFETIIKKRGQEWYESLKLLKVEGESKGGYQGVKYYQEIIKDFKEYLNV